MKKLLMVMFMACLLFSAGCKNFNNKAVITVNDVAITQQDIDKIINKQMNSPFFAKLDKNSKEAKLLKLIAKDKAVNEAIVKRIIDNEIAKRNITVSEDDLKLYKENLLKEIGGEENFQILLNKNNINEDEFKTMIANEIQVGRLINALSPINVSEGEIKKFYNDNKASKFTYPDMVRASHILIKDEAKAKEVLAKAKAPNADFAALAKEFSEDPGSAQNGGDLDYFTKDQMVKSFSDAAFALKPDNVSDLVKSEFGYHIIKVTDRKKAGVTPFADIKAQIKKYLEDEKKVQVLQKFIDSQKSLVTIKFVDESYNPDNIKKEVKKLSSDRKINEQAPAIPATK